MSYTYSTDKSLQLSYKFDDKQVLTMLNEFKVERPKFRTLNGGSTFRCARHAFSEYSKWNNGKCKQYYSITFKGETYWMPSKDMAEMIYKGITMKADGTSPTLTEIGWTGY